MATRQLDVLNVRTFQDRGGASRIIVDFDEDPGTDRFIAIDLSGGVIRCGVDRIELGWEALDQLAELITVSKKTLKPPRTRR